MLRKVAAASGGAGADMSIVKFQRPDNPHRGVHSGRCGGPQAAAGPLAISQAGSLAQLEAEAPPCEPPRHMTSAAPSGGGLVMLLAQGKFKKNLKLPQLGAGQARSSHLPYSSRHLPVWHCGVRVLRLNSRGRRLPQLPSSVASLFVPTGASRAPPSGGRGAFGDHWHRRRDVGAAH
jgi:hypothetical protein